MKKKFRTQYAALPFRWVDGRYEILLVTSRETGRWILPKGWAEKEVKPHDMAAREAFEEAGVVGRVEKKARGRYTYLKRLTATKSVACEVTVFPLEVAEELDEWPERTQRRRCWLSPRLAVAAINDPGLADLLAQLDLPDWSAD